MNKPKKYYKDLKKGENPFKADLRGLQGKSRSDYYAWEKMAGIPLKTSLEAFQNQTNKKQNEKDS